MKVAYTPDAEADIRRLPQPITRRIVEKIDWFAAQGNPLRFAIPLKGAQGIYRFRIGDYRAFFALRKGIVVILLVLAVKHRREAYR